MYLMLLSLYGFLYSLIFYNCMGMLLIMYEKVHFIKLQLKIGQVVNV